MKTFKVRPVIHWVKEQAPENRPQTVSEARLKLINQAMKEAREKKGKA